MAKNTRTKTKPEELTPAQERFCAELAKPGVSQTHAYMKAFGRTNRRSAQSEASRLLSNPIIAQRVQEYRKAALSHVVVEQAEILQELNRIGYSDVRALYNKDGSMKLPHQWPDHVARAVSSVETEVTYAPGPGGEVLKVVTHKVKLLPKRDALELLGKHKKMWTDKIDLNAKGKLTLEMLVAGDEDVPEKGKGGK